MNFTNEELVVLYKKIEKEKAMIDASIERGFMLITHLEDKGQYVKGEVKPINNPDKIKESVVYRNYETIIEKLKPVVEIILDGDQDVQYKFRNIL